MSFKTLRFALSMACAAATTSAFAGTNAPTAPDASPKMDLQQVRNATSKITYGETTFLIDPMLAKKRALTQDLKIPTAVTFEIHWLI
nr:hypothetical protein GCM10020185_88510 [Pseudomonas brassicacearum subsp. brassicacearum]